MTKVLLLLSFFSVVILISCSKSSSPDTGTSSYPSIAAAFGGSIDPNNWINYAGQTVPGYITKDNARGTITNNAKATLGRVLLGSA